MSSDCIRIIPPQAAGELLSDWLFLQGCAVPSPCGGRGTCGKCRVTVVSGTFYLSASPQTPAVPDENGQVFACQVVCPPDGAQIALPYAAAAAAEPTKRAVCALCPEDVGVALDVGTTTLAAALVERQSGRVIASASCLNPQQHFGADVINRISACKDGKLHIMQSCLLQAVAGLLDDLKAPARVGVMTVAGNPTMLHLFCGVSPEGMGHAPFTPAFLETRHLTGDSLGLSVDRVTVLPSLSAFVGSDITAGALYCGLLESPFPALLVDIGTNGEMMLFTGTQRDGRLIAASTAAGPALEGANISCGMGGVDGAVSRVYRGEDGIPIYRTVGDVPPVGVCGCGLLDIVACLLEDGSVDDTGYLAEDPYCLSGRHETAQGIGAADDTPVRLTGRDVRELQLAKSALRAGIETLLDDAEIDAAQVGAVYLAGGLGYYLDPCSAGRIGLLPDDLLPVVRAVGNSALAGAAMCAADPSRLDALEALSAEGETLDLNDLPVFRDAFIEHIMFPSAEEGV